MLKPHVSSEYAKEILWDKIKRNTLTIFYTKSNDTKGDNAYEKNIFK